MKRYTLLANPEDEATTPRWLYVDPALVIGIVQNPEAPGCAIAVPGFRDPVGITASPEEVMADRAEARGLPLPAGPTQPESTARARREEETSWRSDAPS